MVNNKTIDAKILSRMFLSGAKNLEAKKEWINELNVFPVPDGDTGTNMTLTIMSAASEVGALTDPDMESLAKAISSGSLRGARGNSGVILSQLLRGFTRGVRKLTDLDAPAIAAAMERGVETAYKAVMKPKEGTILTVARAAADRAAELADAAEDLDAFFDGIFQHAEETLARTPEMLPVLKEAGVVDSGGQGLLEVFRGAIDGYHGKEVDYSQFEAAAPKITKISPQAEADIKFGYCTEFIINLEKPYGIKEEDDLKQFLESIGDSIVCVSDDEIVKIHVHTNHPGQAFEKGLTFGYLSNMKVDNMRLEHHEKVIKQAEREEAARQEAARQAEKEKQQPKKQYGFIAVSMGDGLKEFFTELGVDYVIEGGQTMNPSTEDMLNAIEKVHAENIFIFPNNKNVVLAANQAAGLCEDKNIIVLATANAPQGISAMIAFDSTMTLEDNKNNMLEAVSNVKSGQVTYAVRDTSIDGKAIHEGDIMGIGDKGLVSVGNDISDVTFDLIKDAVDEDSELISIYYGADVKKEDAEAFAARVEESFPDCDVQNYYGGQPIYYYIVSVE